MLTPTSDTIESHKKIKILSWEATTEDQTHFVSSYSGGNKIEMNGN